MSCLIAVIAHCLATPSMASERITVLMEESDNATMQNLAEDFREDLESIGIEAVEVVTHLGEAHGSDIIYALGSRGGSPAVARLLGDSEMGQGLSDLGPRGGVWAQLKRGEMTVVVLAGADVAGVQYAVYDYVKEVLGIDPFRYWTGTEPRSLGSSALLEFEDRVIEPPLVPILCYFENDVDELANLKEPLLEYSWEDYKAMIDSLVRIRYNAIQIFDMQGRAEFFLREEYIKLRPDYEVDWEYLERMIKYAQLKGMKVMFDMGLGSKLRRISQEESDCWSEHREAWTEAWKYLLRETPVGLGDIFALRPRHQIWDWGYRSSCGEDKVQVMNEVYAVFGALIDEEREGTLKVCICYGDGMEMFNNGFRPPEDFVMLWSDDGWGDFKLYPESTDEYEFGTYMHAGYWLNHDVSNPYPHRVESVMKKMFDEYGATEFCEVNGQTFRPFMINLEAYSEVCRDPDGFSGDDFYRGWMSRYFDEPMAKAAVRAMKTLHAAHFGNVGYVENLWEIKEALAYLSDDLMTRPRRDPIRVGYERVSDDLQATMRRGEILDRAVAESSNGLNAGGRNADFFHDHIALPIAIYADLVAFERVLHELARYKKSIESAEVTIDRAHAHDLLSKAKELLAIVYERRIRGDRNPRWSGWYDPAIRRPNNGFPTHDSLERIADAIDGKWKKSSE